MSCHLHPQYNALKAGRSLQDIGSQTCNSNTAWCSERCSRKILGFPSSYISCVPNTCELAGAAQLLLSKQILKQHMVYFGQLVRRPAGGLVRRSDTANLKHLKGKRRVGRPRDTLAGLVLEHCLRSTTPLKSLTQYLKRSLEAKRSWYSGVTAYCL